MRGIGPAGAARLLACLELSRRAAAWPAAERPVVSTPEDVVRLCGTQLRGLDREHFWALVLSTKNQLLRMVEVSVGSPERLDRASARAVQGGGARLGRLRSWWSTTTRAAIRRPRAPTCSSHGVSRARARCSASSFSTTSSSATGERTRPCVRWASSSTRGRGSCADAARAGAAR